VAETARGALALYSFTRHVGAGAELLRRMQAGDAEADAPAPDSPLGELLAGGPAPSLSTTLRADVIEMEKS
jgi:hypothetical protein